MQQKNFYDLLRERNTARAEYIQARSTFREVLEEMRRVNSADAVSILRLALEECNRTFELLSQAERACAAFIIRSELSLRHRAA